MNEKWKQKYTVEDLFNYSKKPSYNGKYLKQISFPLGGIGSGSIGLSGRGSLIDFEIFNRPNVGSRINKTFPIIRCVFPNSEEEPITRILEGPIQRPYTPLDGGRYKANGEGFPHMDSVEFYGEYPFAKLKFKCEKMPINVELEAYNPYIPSNPDASSIPIAILKYHVSNPTNEDLEVNLLYSMKNIVGYTPKKFQELMIYGLPISEQGGFKNEYRESSNSPMKGIYFTNTDFDEEEELFGSMILATPDEDVSYTKWWKQSIWFASHYHLWNTFKNTGKCEQTKIKPQNKSEAGAISITKLIQPGKTEIFTFYVGWHFPNFYKYWEDSDFEEGRTTKEKAHWKNYYAKLYEDAWDVVCKVHQNEKKYYELTKKFHKALYSSTYPNYVIDAISANMSTLKTPTCIRLENGEFYGWEGCHPHSGCCAGTCLHVWGYEQTTPFLFPSLERSVRAIHFQYNFLFDDIGVMGFRVQLPLGPPHPWGRPPCADGQFGQILHTFREWKISGNHDFLRKYWKDVKKALEFAWEEWDEEKTGVLRGAQHNTYDIEFFGPNPMLSSYYIGALLAAGEMADYLGEDKKAEEYRSIAKKGAQWIDENLFDGEYYIQQIPENSSKINQLGIGCLTDQIVGQQLSKICGLPNFFKKENINSTLRSIFNNNWRPNMYEHENGARLYAVNEEAAVLIASWPKGGRPEIPFPYADEVMNGYEYQFGAHCILEGLIEEGLTVIKSIRDRYDGWGRNPWNEFECGHHYARSMAAYGYLIALSGFEFHKAKNYIGFDPKIKKDDFQTFWALDGVWGVYKQNKEKAEIKVIYGKIDLKSVKIVFLRNELDLKLEIREKQISVKSDNEGMIIFPQTLTIKNEEKMIILKK